MGTFPFYLKTAVKYKIQYKITNKEEYILNYFRSVFYLYSVTE